VVVVCFSGKAPTYQIMWCHNTGHNFSLLGREILKWMQLAISILILVMRSSEMVQCHTVHPFARPDYQMKIRHWMLAK
jgi:lipoprotein signal peptidase